MSPEPPRDAFVSRITERLGDRYEISRELLGGGMSRVFVAREIALDRTVVIKFLPPEIAAEVNRERFRREIQMAARLSHPHIAPLFSAAEEGELLYYTMPFIAGESLRQSLGAGRHFSVSETLEILVDVADALAYAHRAGIVHRDIKPANILREGAHAVITDFGVAKAVSFALARDGQTPRSSTSSGVAIGTPAYMAPEQIAGDPSADHRVDVYAFGLLAYELLTGHAPFRAPSPTAMLTAQMTQAPAPIAESRPDVPPVLAALITRCLEKDPTRRPPSAESVLEVLRAVSSASGGAVTGTWPRSARATPVMVGAGLAVAGIALWIIAARMQPETTAPPAGVRSVDSARRVVAAPPLPAPPPARRAPDSTRGSSADNAKRDARLLSLLRDSISNAVHRSVTDSIARAKEAELAAAHVRDSVAAANLARPSANVFRPPPRDAAPPRMPLTRETFAARAANMGPARRVGVSIYSGLRGSSIVIGAGVVRDSIIARLRGSGRFVIVPPDSIAARLARSTNIDSLRAWAQTELWISINLSGEVGADSLRWQVTARDFAAHRTYAIRSTSSRPVALANVSEPAAISALVESVVRAVDEMDRAPRREVGAPKGPGER